MFQKSDEPGVRAKDVEDEATNVLEWCAHPVVADWARAAFGLSKVCGDALLEVDAMMSSQDALEAGINVRSSHSKRGATHFRGRPGVSLGRGPWARTTLASLLDVSGVPGGPAGRNFAIFLFLNML